MNTATNTPDTNAAEKTSGSEGVARAEYEKYMEEQDVREENFARLLTDCVNAAKQSEAFLFALGLASHGYEKIRVKGGIVSVTERLSAENCENDHSNILAMSHRFRLRKKDARVSFIMTDFE
jgi:hypothetical protein